MTKQEKLEQLNERRRILEKIIENEKTDNSFSKFEKLNPEQKGLFDEAFLDAFDEYSQLDKLFDHYFTTKLSRITTKNKNIDENIIDIRNWASRHYKIKEIMSNALKIVDGNRQLEALQKIIS